MNTLCFGIDNMTPWFAVTGIGWFVYVLSDCKAGNAS